KGQQYAQLKRDANRTTGNYHCDAGVAACDSGDAQIFLPVELASIQAGRSTNWQDLVLRQGQQVNNEIRIAGGDERTRFALSGGSSLSRASCRVKISRGGLCGSTS